MNIVDCFTETMAFTLHFINLADKDQPNYNQISENYEQLIRNSRALINDDKLSFNDWERSFFAICAWVDEKILLSNWQDKEQWQLNPLQKQYFRTTQAGEKFYEVLDRFDPVLDCQVVEVFNYCIKLGFQGKNFDNKPVNQVVTAAGLPFNYTELKSENLIFEAAYKTNADELPVKVSWFGFRSTLLMIFLMSLAGLGILNLIYNMLLNDQFARYFR